jgi:Ca2+-binding EF-hand superfamily protein
VVLSLLTPLADTQAREVFQKYDRDRSGAIDTKELPPLLRELNLRLSPELYARYCEKFLREGDTDARFVRRCCEKRRPRVQYPFMSAAA